jgi:hypothetical protein
MFQKNLAPWHIFVLVDVALKSGPHLVQPSGLLKLPVGDQVSFLQLETGNFPANHITG